ncbi:hypothetical protein B0A48_16358 [Cryoendolithus antarcticus]|uniref:NADH dehydrogenase [ubiquinone] iron-sulfur protein 4, mitochondrial n=1 Tax=Cryoendolithus antarcticus TaxID=1507870 RepID=A0A1V8SDN4_9PEZI|nr:hypothetical protein B0A48_16358 [Cryoendolithus antarcticus]
MAPLQRFAASTLRASTRPAITRRVPAASTIASRSVSDASPGDRGTSSPSASPGARPGASAMIRQEGASEGQPRHAPDYDAVVDYRTSIYQPAKTATQSGSWHGHHWRMDWDVMSKGHRWENPLMGWQSSADAMQGTRLSFNSREDAINFANKQGYEYFVQEPNERKFVPKAYANQFLHDAGRLKQVRTK